MSSLPRVPFADRLWSGWRRRGWRGFHRAWHALRQHAPGNTLLATSSYGGVFALNPLDYIDAHVLTHGFYESEVLEALRPRLATGGVLWDIGANIGLHSVTAKSLWPTATVCSFEPAPPTMTRLQLNAALNSVELRLHALALSDRDGTAALHLGQPGNPGMSTLSPWHDFTYAGTCHVATLRGDSLVATGSAPAPTVIKLDVEGHEPAVLRGLPDTLRADACRAVVFEDVRTDDSESKQLLRAAGFHLTLLDRREATDHPLGNFLAEKP